MSGTDADLPTLLPAWVRKRDGRLESFDAEEINRALFAATEAAGQPDAFTARELTDGVLHFLAVEHDETVIPSLQIAETLAKVVREFGHPVIARLLGEGAGSRQADKTGEDAQASHPKYPPETTADPLAEVFAPNLIQAHREGLLRLDGWQTPGQLTSLVTRLPLQNESQLRAAVEHARELVGQSLILDGIESELRLAAVTPPEVGRRLRWLADAAMRAGLTITLHAGCRTAPSWAGSSDYGPLFALVDADHVALDALRDALADELAASTQWPICWYWHLGPDDFTTASSQRRLGVLLQAAGGPASITFVFDRPRRPVVLGAGIDRDQPAILCWVGLGLPVLQQRLRVALTPDEFLHKARSLARLAVSAGVQKRNYLRQHPTGQRPPFVIDQARSGIYLLGLTDVVKNWFAGVASAGEKELAAIRDFGQRLSQTLERESPSTHLNVVLDDGPAHVIAGQAASACAASTGDWWTNLRHEGLRHAAWGRGTVPVPLPKMPPPNLAALMELLRFALEQTSVSCLRFIVQDG